MGYVEDKYIVIFLIWRLALCGPGGQARHLAHPVLKQRLCSFAILFRGLWLLPVPCVRPMTGIGTERTGTTRLGTGRL